MYLPKWAYSLTAWATVSLLLFTVPPGFVLPADAALMSISTAVGQGADGELTESESTSDGSLNDATGGGNGTGVTMNARSTITNRFDMIVVRFDLSSVADKSLIQNASINLVSNRVNEVHPLRYWALAPGTTNGANTAENWAEVGLDKDTFPGVTVDGDSSTSGIVLASVTDLGQGSGANSDVAGGIVTFGSSALDLFLQGLGTTNLATFLITMDDIDSGQMRYNTKENGAGSTAPYLQFDVVPEPATWTLLAMGLAYLGARRRCCG